MDEELFMQELEEDDEVRRHHLTLILHSVSRSLNPTPYILDSKSNPKLLTRTLNLKLQTLNPKP
jgi:hypothetical protein